MRRLSSSSSSTYTSSSSGDTSPSSSSSSWPPHLRSRVPTQATTRTTSVLYADFMGHSTRFRDADPPLTRDGITALERETLAHSPPGRVNDHVCIGMVKTLRWLSDRFFRERYIHRATMLTPIASAAPAAGMGIGYIRMYHRGRENVNTPPFTPGDTGSEQTYSGSTEELRGLYSQSECHGAHHHILSCMAEIMPVERLSVLLLHTAHYVVFAVLFAVYPRMAFRLLGYLAEESSVVWTQMINDIDLGKIGEYRVPEYALSYWGLHDRFTAQTAPAPAVMPRKVSTAATLVTEPDTPRPPAPVQAEVAGTAQPVKERETSSGNAKVDSKSQKRTSTGFSEPEPQPPASSSSDEMVRPPFEISSTAIPVVREPPVESVTAVPHPRSDVQQPKEESRPSVITRGHRRGSGSHNESGKEVLTLRDVVLLIRSDEMFYRDLNHQAADLIDSRRKSNSWAANLLKKVK